MHPKLAAALATCLWGATYIITTGLLPHNPMFIAAVRALGGALLLLLLAREALPPAWWGRIIVLGSLNCGLFFAMLFIAAVRLPGGMAATFQALGPLFMILCAWPLLGATPTRAKIASLLVGVAGVALVVLKSGAAVDIIGVAAALTGAFSVALGGVLLNKWGRPISVIGMTAWQLVVAALELGAVAFAIGDVPHQLTAQNMFGLALLATAITALPFVLWFRALHCAGVATVAPFLLLTPIIAFLFDAVFRGVSPSLMQAAGVLLVVGSLLSNQRTWGKPSAA